jgi:hypothetical protein
MTPGAPDQLRPDYVPRAWRFVGVGRQNSLAAPSVQSDAPRLQSSILQRRSLLPSMAI